jgi:mono/diheme cytochrome c family protein
MQRKLILWASVIVVVIIVVLVPLFALLVPGLSSARSEPPAAETMIATWLLHQSVPNTAKMMINPLGSDPADVTAGRELYREKCELCHAYDGSGKTNIGAGQYPHPPALRSAAIAMSDGEIFYHIRNGIRNTAMPAWELPDREIWQLVAYIRDLPKVAQLTSEAAPLAPGMPRSERPYAGSAACQRCHESLYARWSKTRMANVVRDPREHPDVIIPDFSKPDPLLTFSKDDIALVYGSRWKQRYFKKVGNDYFVLPAQWDVAHQMWRPYFVPNGADLGGTLSARQFPAPDCAALRRLPFGQFRYRCENHDRMECRLRKVPWTWCSARRPSDPRQHSQSGSLRLRSRQRHLHPVPFPGSASQQPHPGKILRLAGRF